MDGTGGVVHLYDRNLSVVCERLVGRGHEVTAVSSRVENPPPDSEEPSRVPNVWFALTHHTGVPHVETKTS